MYKNILVILIFLSYLNGEDIFATNCKSCHANNLQLTMIMSRYTLKFSSEKRIKEAMKNFLKQPSREKSTMPLGFLSRFNIKEVTTLNNEELDLALDIYYKQFNLKNYFP